MQDASDQFRRIGDGWQRAYREANDDWQRIHRESVERWEQLHSKTLVYLQDTGRWMAFFGMLTVAESLVIFYLLLLIERA